MKKRLIALLVMLQILTFLTLPACAAAKDTILPGGTTDEGGIAFTDVPTNAWYAEAVEYCRVNGLMDSFAGTTFSPDTAASRAVLVTALYRAAGSPATQPEHFPDVADDSWYGPATAWASASGRIKGYSDGRFGPDDMVTREQLALILWRSEGYPVPIDPAEPFADQRAIAHYATDAVAWSQGRGIFSGKGGNRFDPKGSITRVELATVLYRWLNSKTPEGPNSLDSPGTAETAMPKLSIRVGNQIFTATLVDTATTRALLDRLPTTLTMYELNGNEKYHYLFEDLPTAAERPDRIQAGDLMLYDADCMVLFYESFSSQYSYTRLGSIDAPTGLAEALGSGSVDVTIRAE